MNDDLLKIDLSTRLAVNPNLVLRVEADDCALLFDPDNGRVQMLNSTAVDLWQRLDGQRSLHDVIENLKELYDGIDETAVRQIMTTIETLADLGAVGIWEQG